MGKVLVEEGEVWVKRRVLGKGTYGTVYFATLESPSASTSTSSSGCLLPPQFAVKSAPLSKSTSLQNEKEILEILTGCPEIIQCYGDQLTIEKGKISYDLLLEYTPVGTLRDLIDKSPSRSGCGGKLSESEIKPYIRMILKGLAFMHDKGYVHCDIKPDNILLFPSSQEDDYDDFNHHQVKLADFGLAKRIYTREASAMASRKYKYTDIDVRNVRGTARYNSPESVAGGVHEEPMDIWAVGCVMVEMLTGKPPWWRHQDNLDDLLYEIVFGKEGAAAAADADTQLLSAHAEQFLKKCLVREPNERWTADMLLKHPFLDKDFAYVETLLFPSLISSSSTTTTTTTTCSPPFEFCQQQQRLSISEVSLLSSKLVSKFGWNEAQLINHLFSCMI